MIKHFCDLEQGTPDWFKARCGLLTASEMKYIITPAKLAYAQNEKEKSHLYEIAAQRITEYVEPHYISNHMLNGKSGEICAKIKYNEHYAGVKDCGFITNDKWGFTLGYSPDALVGDEGQIEVKTRLQKFQLETILDARLPSEYIIQIQTGLLVSERLWCDFISYSGGMYMLTLRVYPEPVIMQAIANAAAMFHNRLSLILASYEAIIAMPNMRLIPTERIIEDEIKV